MMGIIFSFETLYVFDKIGVDINSELVDGGSQENTCENIAEMVKTDILVSKFTNT